VTVKATLVLATAVALLAAGCTDETTEPRPESGVDVASKPSEPPPTGDDRPSTGDDRPRRPRPGSTLKELRRSAAADGRIDRKEAIRLALGVPKLRVKDVETTLDGGRWTITLWELLGCHSFRTLDADTGRPVGTTGGGGCY
jgi:hypothetical protein